MPNDAKLGLIVGVGIVFVVAIVFFRKDQLAGPLGDAPAAAVSAPTLRNARLNPRHPPRLPHRHRWGCRVALPDRLGQGRRPEEAPAASAPQRASAVTPAPGSRARAAS